MINVFRYRGTMRRWLTVMMAASLVLSVQPASAEASSDVGLASPAETVLLSAAQETVTSEKPPLADAIVSPPPATKVVSSDSKSPAKGLPHDLSPWGMFKAADIVVKAIMIGLAAASLATWIVWLAKVVELAYARRRLCRGISGILSAEGLDHAVATFARSRGTSAIMVREAADEMRVSAQVLQHGSAHGVNERITSRLSRLEVAAGRRMAAGTGVLATIGATAPFIGLFGTVWGIMNSFIGISQSQTTNLAVVAPGIAEALLATALGLVAAIPAVIIYNVFSRSITSYRQLLGDASAGIERLVSRELDVRRLSAREGLVRIMLPRAAE